ncbi:MAG: hypothetical protein IKE69_07900 [Thermoguttaceae bacterium]|nr:hypothetical protein [Thermoguttaceae bacterium]
MNRYVAAPLSAVFSWSNTPKKISYLDCDTIVRGNLSELWNTDLDGAALAGVIDRSAIELWGDYTKTLTYGGIPGHLNAGVLMMNLDLIRALKTDKAALELLNTLFYQFADQDVLNITCKGQVAHGHARYATENDEFKGKRIDADYICVRSAYCNPSCYCYEERK